MNKNKTKEDDIKKCTHYDQYQKPWYKKIKIDEKSNKNIFTYHIRHVTSNGVKPLHLIINKFYGYIDELHGNKCLTLLHTDKNKHTLKKYEKL